MESSFAALAVADPGVVTGRVFFSLIIGLVFMIVVGKILGPERKAKWFKRRENYSFFNRRGVIGEALNFGYPRTLEGIAVFVGINIIVFGFAFWNVILRGY